MSAPYPVLPLGKLDYGFLAEDLLSEVFGSIL